MKNYNVKAIKKFNDVEENVQRQINETFRCTKARYLFLKENNAVVLIGIDKEAEEASKQKIENTNENNEENKSKKEADNKTTKKTRTRVNKNK